MRTAIISINRGYRKQQNHLWGFGYVWIFRGLFVEIVGAVHLVISLSLDSWSKEKDIN